MTTTTSRHLLTADEYQHMAETSILNEDERIDLLGGEMHIETATGLHPRHLSADEYQQIATLLCTARKANRQAPARRCGFLATLLQMDVRYALARFIGPSPSLRLLSLASRRS